MMAKKRSPVDLPLPVIRAQKSAAFTEEKRDEIADRKDAALWEMAQRIGGPQAIRELKPKLDKQANIEYGVSFDVLVKEIGLTAAVSKLGFGAQFIEAAKLAGLLGAIARLGCGPGAKAVYRAKSNSNALRPLNGSGADSTLLERAIRTAELRHEIEISKCRRRLQNLENIIAQNGVDANRDKAIEREALVLSKYMGSTKPEHNRASLIANELQISAETVRQILDRVGIKKRKTPKTTNSQDSA